MKRILGILLALLLCCAPVAALAASEDPFLCSDEAGYLTEQEITALQQLAETELFAKQDMRTAIYTVYDMEGADPKAYATSLLGDYAKGSFGVVILLEGNTGEIHIYSFGEDAKARINSEALQQVLNDAIAAYQTDNSMYTLFETCMLQAAEASNEVEPESSEGSEAVSETESIVEPVYDKQCVDDSADLLTDAEEADLQQELEDLHHTYGGDYIIVTTWGTDGQEIMAFADDYFDYNGYEDNGVLLAVDMENRKWWISTEGFGIQALTDADITNIGSVVAAGLKAEAYYDAFHNFIVELDGQLADWKASTPEKKPEGSAEEFLVDNGGLFAEDQAEMLKDQLAVMREFYGVDVVIVTGDYDMSVYDTAGNYAAYEGYASDVIVLAMKEYSRYIEASGIGGEAVTYEERDLICEQIGEQADAFSAAYTFMEAVDMELKQSTGTAGSVFGGSTFAYSIRKWWRGIQWSTVLICFGAALLIAFIATGIMKRGMKTARPQYEAREYIKEGSFNLTRSADMYLYSHTTRRRIVEQDNDSNGSSGGSSTHRSSSGDTHGGGGGSF